MTDRQTDRQTIISAITPALLPWIHSQRNLLRNYRRRLEQASTVNLDQTFDTVETVPGLKTNLYQHQKTAIRAMLDLEQHRVFTIAPTTRHYKKITYNSAVLSEPVGSGKTIDILSVILLSKVPKAMPDITPLAHITDREEPRDTVSFVKIRFKTLLKPTIIFVGVSVLKQWTATIERMTDLRFFVVSNALDLKKLFTIITTGKVNDYDIILVKNGKITIKIDLPEGIEKEPKNCAEQTYIYNMIANLRHHCWARVVVDDFDTIRLPSNAGIVRGLFTWYVSSTRKAMGAAKRGPRYIFTSAAHTLKHLDYHCSGIMRNDFLFEILNVRNNVDFINETTRLPNPKFHIVQFENVDNNYISMLLSINDEQARALGEMLNSDAVDSAAESLGIKQNSVVDIFTTVLGKKFSDYRFAGDLLAFIDYQQEREHERKAMADNPDPEDKYYGKTRLLKFENIEYKYPGVNTLLDDTKTEYRGIKELNGTAIQRVKDNIAHGSCPVCRENLETFKSVIIVKCCNTVFCNSCGIQAQLLQRYKNGRCSNCRRSLTVKDLIYIGSEIKLENILSEQFEDDAPEAEVKVPEVPTSKPRVRPFTKYTAITDIIRRDPVESQRVDMHLAGMMKGSAHVAEPAVRKVLIFANYDETLSKVSKELKEQKINHWVLHGSASEIDRTARQFTDCSDACALIINSTKHCSGLNLQTATDLIFMHKIIDTNIESQVVGRGHRLGRVTPLNVWFFTYQTEYQQIIESHGMRLLTDEEIAAEP